MGATSRRLQPASPVHITFTLRSSIDDWLAPMSRIARSVSFLLALTLALSPLAMGAFGMGLPAAASADGEITWSVEPVPTSEGVRRTFDYKVDPGTQIVDSVLITNSGPTAADFLIYATDATNELETGAFGLLKRDQKPVDIGSWITTASDKLTIQPGQQATVPFNLLVPSDAAPGDHVAGIVAAVLTTGTQDGAAVTLEQRVGARVYLKVSGVPDVGVEATGLVSSYSPELNPFAPGTLAVTYDVKNTGNLRLDVNQKIAIAGPFGIPLGEYTPEPVSNLLPRQTVRIRAQVPAIVALLLAWSTVTLTPGDVGSAAAPGDPTSTPTATAQPTETPTATPSASAVVTDQDVVDFIPVSATVTTLAVSWTLLAIVILVIAAIFLVRRYVIGTRERFYDAIEEASAAAREEALSGSSGGADRT